MHYHLEIVMPKTNDIHAAVTEILEPFSESNEEGYSSFWDWWQLGGRYSGSKKEAIVGQDKIDAFTEELKARGVTCSGLVWGKQELSPSSQIEMVDQLWREMCPGGGDVCPIFKHSGDADSLDVCAFKDIPPKLSAYKLIVAAPDYKGKKLEAVTMYSQSLWNGVTHEDTKWNGNVAAGIEMHLEKLERYAPEYAQKVTPGDDWIAVTVDYHS